VVISDKKTQPDLFKDVWITAGVFLSHYLLERMPDEGIEIVEGKE